MSEHTKGPWEVCIRNGSGGVAIAPVHDALCIADCLGWPLPGEAAAKANAERIVACVNACEGLADPSVVPELVKQARRMVEVVHDYGSYDGQIADAAKALASILAKAEGR